MSSVEILFYFLCPEIFCLAFPDDHHHACGIIDRYFFFWIKFSWCLPTEGVIVCVCVCVLLGRREKELYQTLEVG